MDAYSGYNQILMHKDDKARTSFIIERGTYCYKVMPFGLKNTEATYQRLVNKIFKEQIGKTMEVYVDDMLVKAPKRADYIKNLAEAFSLLRQYCMMLNPCKCTFGVSSGRFLGYLVTKRGIEAHPRQIKAILEMKPPSIVKEIKSLNGRAATLNQFLSRSTDKCRPFFKALKKGQRDKWDDECEVAFQNLKTYLTSPPVLSKPVLGEDLYVYLAVSNSAISLALIREELGAQHPVFYMSKALLDAETRYPKLEKLIWALIEQSSPKPLSPRTATVRAGLRRKYSSSSVESKSYESEGSSNMAEIPNNNNNVEGGGALVVQPRKALREFSIPKVTDQPSCIVYPQLTVDRFELKSGMIQLLPTYYGNTTEDPYMHIKQFFEICDTIKIQGLDDEQIKMRLFPFSLRDKAKSWLYSLPNASIHTWEELSNKFLQKFFPAQKTNKIRKEILGFTQKEGEAFHECWERMMIDATSGEGLMNKTAYEAFTLFESLSANSQQWSHNKGRGAPMKAVVSEVSTNNEIAANLDVMCSLLQQAVTGPLGNKVEVQDQSFAEHMLEQANALQARNPQNDPYSNTYNPGWRNHPNFKWSNNSNVQQSQGPPPGFQTQQRQFQQAPQQVQEQRGDQMGELQDMFKKFMGQHMQTNQNLQNAVNKLEVQVGQIASFMSNRASGTFPSQTEVNQRQEEHAKAVHILRSGKQVDNKVGDANEEQEDGENVEIIQPPHGQPTTSNKQSLNPSGKTTNPKVSSNANQVPISTNAFRPIAPFPSRLSKSKKDQGLDEIMETFKKVQINIPLLRFQTDFLVLEMEEAPIHDNQLPLILGRPFMAIAGAIIDVKKGENETLPIIITSHLGPNDEKKLLRVLKEHKTAIGWSIADIKGISPTLCMHKILLEDNAMPKRDAQRRLNPNMKEVNSGITVVKNEANELVPTRMTTGWRVCIDYRKLNTTTSKDHFPLPFVDQMLERLAGHSHYCFLDGYSGYNQIAIAPEDQEKTTFTCPFGTFAYRRMPFGLCNAPTTFQRCMMSIFSDIVERFIEVFMDDFSIFGDSFDQCLHNLSKVLARCEQTNLVLNWEKCHFMVNQGIVLGHVISSKGIEVDKAKIDLIASMPSPTSVKEVRFFLGHVGFYRRFIKDFSKIARPICNLLAKDMDFVFHQDCENAFNALKKMLTTAPIIIPSDWSLPFELMCDTSDYAVGAVLG
ncbi:hypothetical protein L3X38_033251 [Prunus dulcis]|uniref:Reverse transcriptase domain-containing protein n=1 Tax=Prunus dulcis TaxID=3755 RepID=A0AAD4VGQ7_PRUDU|nr:hypothetical protein L3X38_033251 [Prunus dulcis]